MPASNKRKTYEMPVPLSTKSLQLVWSWCEKNEDTPLAELYFDACETVGNLDRKAILRQLDPEWPSKGWKYHTVSINLYDMAYMLRDGTGRVILELIKKENKIASKLRK